MAQVKLHKVDITTGLVSQVYVPITPDTVYRSVTQTLPTSISGNTQLIIKERRDGGKQYRLLETPSQIDGLNLLAQAIGSQAGASSLTQATLNMLDVDVTDIAHAAVGTTQGGGTIKANAVFVNVSTATATTVIANTLPVILPNTVVVIKNPQTFALSIFPPVGGSINSGAVNAAYTLAAGTTTSFITKNVSTTTSTTSVAIGTGTKTFTVASGLIFPAGAAVLAWVDNSNYMNGTVVSYTGNTLVLSISAVTGSGTNTSWTISGSNIYTI
jgi:hypothetical protein